MFISIGLTVHNRLKLSEYCINSIHNNTPRDKYELLVVDNFSSDYITNTLFDYYHEGYIDRFFPYHKNNLGSAINLAWSMADPSTEWLLVLDNDNFCMKGWLDNFKIIANDLNPDFVFTQIRMPGFQNASSHLTKNGGKFLEFQPTKKIPYGAGLAIKKSLVDKYKIRFPEGDKPWSIGKTQGSIYTSIGMRLRSLNLNYIDLGKPCILVQDCEYANPEYFEYYSKVFGYPGRGGHGHYGIGKEEMSKFESLRMRGGNTRYPDRYYEGADYEIKEHYRNALNSKEGQVLWNESRFEAPKDFFEKE